jgi:hypothetical protein
VAPSLKVLSSSTVSCDVTLLLMNASSHSLVTFSRDKDASLSLPSLNEEAQPGCICNIVLGTSGGTVS